MLVIILSFITYLKPGLSYFAFGSIVALVLAFSFWKLEYGLLLVLGELFVGSFGYLFYLSLDGQKLSLRLVIFAALMLAFALKFAWQLIRSGRQSAYLICLRRLPAAKYWLFIAFFLVVALSQGYLKGQTAYLFPDFNAWLYLLLVLPAACVYSSRGQTEKKRLTSLFLAASVIISLETLALLFIFTRDLLISPLVYDWLRDNLIGEMTNTASGWPRIFLQAQVFPLLAFIILMFRNIWAKLGWRNLLLAGIFLSSALASFSRSFWAGLLAAAALALALAWARQGFRRFFRLGLWSLSALVSGFVIIYAVSVFPYPQPGSFKADFLDRVSNGQEAAISSRWSQLPPLSQAILKNPLLGQGFGATITYVSSDPRVLANHPDGLYTTYAFEWGYLDMALEFGLLGLSAFLILIFQLLRSGWQAGKDIQEWLPVALAGGLVFLAVTHIFSPYLNHPLGLGYLILASCLIPLNRV